jgi:hypothetical protein
MQRPQAGRVPCIAGVPDSQEGNHEEFSASLMGPTIKNLHFAKVADTKTNRETTKELLKSVAGDVVFSHGSCLPMSWGAIQAYHIGGTTKHEMEITLYESIWVFHTRNDEVQNQSFTIEHRQNMTLLAAITLVHEITNAFSNTRMIRELGYLTTEEPFHRRSELSCKAEMSNSWEQNGIRGIFSFQHIAASNYLESCKPSLTHICNDGDYHVSVYQRSINEHGELRAPEITSAT